MAKKVNQKDVARELAAVREVTIKEAEGILEDVLTILDAHIEAGDAVTFYKRLRLEEVVRNERKGRNPQTGEEMVFPAHKTYRAKLLTGWKDLGHKTV